MSTIDNYIGGITPEPKPVKSYGDKSLDQSDFMTLLGAQLQHQDPMKPMENGEFIAEMAQFSALESANNLTDAFKQLSTTMLSSASLQASLLVGKTVSFASNSVNLAEQGANLSARNPASGIVSLEVRDEAGAIVYSHSQMTEPGKYQHFWDGTGGVPGQQYQISLFNSTLEEDLQPEVQDKVKSVDVSGTDIAIKLALNGQIAQSNLIEIFDN